MNNAYHDFKYFDLVKDVLENGVRKTDRTGTGTISVFSRQMRFDLSNGTIPLLTTKKMHTRSIIHEILWYLTGTGDAKYLVENKISIWDEWMSSRNTLGPVYGAMWRAYPPPPLPLPIKKLDVVDKTEVHNWKQVDMPSVEDGKYSNCTFTNVQGRQYIVLGVDGRQRNGSKGYTTTYAIKFVESGWVKHMVSTRLVRTGRFVDQSLPSVYNVGILGDFDHKRESNLDKKLRRIWENMISRCYNEKDIAFETHGGRGVKVCNRWKVLSDFLQDVKKLPNWFVRRHNDSLVLDKDYYGTSKLYHPETACWISKEHNNKYRRDAIAIEATAQSGDSLFFCTEKEAADYFGVTGAAIRGRRLNKNTNLLHGFKIAEFSNSEFLIRYRHTIDQISTLINELKTNPNSRRLLVSGWNPGLLPLANLSASENALLGYQALPPCHYTFQFWTRPFEVDGETKYQLSCMLNQRSCDVGLGVPFNIVQYSILTRMVAQVVGMIPGEFIWNGGDVHIYTNHIDSLRQQIMLEPYPSPKLVLNPNVDDIDSFKFEDFTIVGYESHPTIKMEVSV